MLKIKCAMYRKTKFPRLNVLYKIRYNSSSSVSLGNEFTDKPEYPPIVSVTPAAEEQRKRSKYYDKLKELPTVEEKLFALNLPRYYGWPTFLLKEGVIPYNFLTFIQHITRTELYETNNLPIYLESEKAENLINKIKPHLEKVLVFEKFNKKFMFEMNGSTKDISDSEINDIYSRNLIYQINRIFVNNLISEYKHLLLSQIDYKPRLESFWRVGGFYPTAEDKELRKKKNVPEEMHDDPIERCFQYIGSPALQIRNRLPLSPFSSQIFQSESTDNKDIEATDEISPADSTPNQVHYNIEPYRYDPLLYYRVPRDYMMAVVSPGFWPNDPFQFGSLSYHTRGYLLDRPPTFGEVDTKEALHSQGILTSYAWSLAQAYYQGFSTFYDITYPFVSQTVVTDGKLFNFYAYQLNTTVLHSNFTNNEINPLKNICYGTVSEELYHEISDNRIKGWNDKVLYNLLSFYANVPTKRVDTEMQKYLSKNKVIANTDDVERRIWIHDAFRNHTARRPRGYPMPEIYDWELIYKVKFNKRPMDPKRRFFELDQDPINDRKLCQHRKRYIPKKFRPPERKKWEKYENTYYPDVYPDYVDIV